MTPATPTQTRHPRRAAARTIVQTAISIVLVLGIAWPSVDGIVRDELAQHATLPAWLDATLVAVGAAVAVTAGILSRVMAIPQVDHALRRIGLSAAPRPDSPSGEGLDVDDLL